MRLAAQRIDRLPQQLVTLPAVTGCPRMIDAMRRGSGYKFARQPPPISDGSFVSLCYAGSFFCALRLNGSFICWQA